MCYYWGAHISCLWWFGFVPAIPVQSLILLPFIFKNILIICMINYDHLITVVSMSSNSRSSLFRPTLLLRKAA